MTRLALFGAAVLLLGGCQFRQTPVPLSGHPSHIVALAGTWNGTYSGAESGRTGSIHFTIRASGDSAFGDVLMEGPPGARIQAADNQAAHALHVVNQKLLAITFVEVRNGAVEGALEPYVAPDCDCVVRTTFIGRIIGDTIRGTFGTRGQILMPQSGTWSVVREK